MTTTSAFVSQALIDYTARIGAKKTNHPRKFVIDSVEDYLYGRIKKNIVTVFVEANGEVHVHVRSYYIKKETLLPTDEERQKIREEFAAAGNAILLSVPATEPLLRDLKTRTGSDQLFVYRDFNGSDVLMVQQRVFYDGDRTDKHDLPWSFWSDGQWRNCEPDGQLPLFGLEQLASGRMVMIHEGAKAALTWQEAVAKNTKFLRDHPLGEDLRHFAHLGWPGGAPNPHRCDWNVIKNLSTHCTVTLVCDYDSVGIDASSYISRTLGRNLRAIRFDDERFKQGFDFADDWPRDGDWWVRGHYVGPTLEDFIQSITWATEFDPIGAGRQGKPRMRVRRQFADEWFAVTKPACFIQGDMKTSEAYDKELFNDLVRPFSDVKDTSQLLAQVSSSRAQGLEYSPANKPGRLKKQDRSLINTYRPSSVKAKKGDVTKFLGFMKYLIPDEKDCFNLMRWCATLVAAPPIKMKYGVLLISEKQGVGKGTLGAAILAPLVGRHNTSFPSESMLIDSKFNSWAAHKRLIVVHEIYAGHSRKGYDHTKSLIVDADLAVNKKFLDEYTVENWSHVFACSNSVMALHLDEDDRRWFLPQVTSELKPTTFWEDFYEWLRGGGLDAIAFWSHEFVKEHGSVGPADHAPKSATKDNVIDESRTFGVRVSRDAVTPFQELYERGIKVVIAVEDVRALIAHRRSMDGTERYTEKSSTLLAAMLSVPGVYEPPKIDNRRQRVMIYPEDGPKYRSHIVSNFPISGQVNFDEIREFFKNIRELIEI